MATAQTVFDETPRVTCLEAHFARFLARLAGAEDAALRAAAVLACRATSNGDVCVRLDDYAGRAIEGLDITAPSLRDWIALLRRSPVVGMPEDFRPLVLDDDGRLYLYRYWQYESQLARDLLDRACDADDVDPDLLRDGLERLFPDPRDLDQKRAAAMAVLRRLCVISGGPGTGKTYAVVKILALLAAQARGRKLAIALAAPTGKAAARVQEAVRQALDHYPADDPVRACVPAEAHTLHRLLGARPGSVYYRHNRDRPLALDVLVVDEASMADLALMAKLLAALPARARLILLGDKDQLASVEAGAVLGDICAGRGMSAAFAARLASVMGGRGPEPRDIAAAHSPLGNSIALLHRSYRFGADTPIGKLAASVNGGQGETALAHLKAAAGERLAWRTTGAPELRTALDSVLDRLAGYVEHGRSGAPHEVFERFNAFRVLCAHRGGAFGALAVNRLIESLLEEKGLIDARRAWYPGRPVMVRRNDYNLQLYNGDVGIALPAGGAEGPLKIFFPEQDGTMRGISPARLPEHETVYAMTIHKAQGSEFGRVLIILPQELSRVMSRELIYTGITRAREQVEIWGAEEAFVRSVERRLARASALQQRLWQ
ncbi:MAG: exodeoxyribonuclease V subunit alpha [Betaproteobacteria bacterium]